MNKAHDAMVADQFGPRANAYVESAVHARGEDLAALEAVVKTAAPVRALDMGSGGGHVAYLMARHAKSVVAVDLSAEMLAAVTETAKSKGLANIETHRASVDRLPFADGSFDLVVSRYSAHHWHNFDGGLREARRVARPGAPVVLMDVFTPGVALLDTHLQSVELLRDTSHVRNYTMAEWSEALARAGLTLKSARTWRLHLEFESWIARMRTPEVFTAAIRALQAGAPKDVRDHFAIKDDGSFTIDTMMLETVAG
ncbi:MAG: class I SAM-dependent methyltransferase [Pseudomonadota bacterium]